MTRRRWPMVLGTVLAVVLATLPVTLGEPAVAATNGAVFASDQPFPFRLDTGSLLGR